MMIPTGIVREIHVLYWNDQRNTITVNDRAASNEIKWFALSSYIGSILTPATFQNIIITFAYGGISSRRVLMSATPT